MSDREWENFDGPRLVAGTVFGVRAFNLSTIGTLHGIANSGWIWTRGWRAAKCIPNFNYTGPNMYYRPHRVASRECGCGFWAYWDGSNTRASEHTVTGIIEGKGLVTVGTKGFRAEQARLVALVVPVVLQRSVAWNWWRLMVTSLGFLMGGTIVAMTGSWHGWAILSSLFGALVAVAGAVGVSTLGYIWPDLSRTRRKLRTPWDRREFQYPTVPVFQTIEAALRQYPLSRPPTE